MESCKKLIASCFVGRGRSTIAVLLALLIVFGLIAPPPAVAQIGAIAVAAAAAAVVSLIVNTIGGLLGTANGLLGSINGFVQALANLWQNVVYPINLINQALAMVNQLIAQFRGLVAAIDNVNVPSATLPNPTSLEVIMRNRSVADFAQFDQAFRTTFQPLPPASDLHPGDRQRVDMSDALAMDTLKTLKASDQVVQQTLQAAQTLFANDLLKSLSPSSVPIYMREVLAAFAWAQSDDIVLRNRWSLFGPPPEVRNVLREYLIVAAKCKLTTRADRLGVKVTYVCQTSETGINIRILLAALRRFYDHLIASKGYGHANPLLQEQMDQIRTDLRNGYREAVRSSEGRDPMPSVSGVDPPFGIRLSANFFRCVDREWIPRTIDDPDFPHLVYSAGKDYGWGLRELCVVRMLFESGARISEILALTALDWSGSQFMNQFEAQNKGSFGIRTKRLVVSSATAKLCRRYFDNETEGRRAHDRRGLTLNDLAKLDAEALGRIPLFLTDRGTPMRAKIFRRGHWTPALRAAGIHASPHLARHWFVTNALRTIEKTSKDENETTRRKAELVQYMGWRSAERTLKAYEHVTRDASFVTTTLTTIHAAMKKREDAIKKDPAVLSQYQPVRQSNAGVRDDPELALLTGVYQ